MNSVINFLFECLNLKHIKRSGWYFSGVAAPESVAEHSLHAGQVGYILAKMEGADAHKVATMLLWHDIAEIRIGDIHYLGGKYVREKHVIEKKVADDQLQDLPMKSDIQALLNEYEAEETIESKVAKDADTLNSAFQCKAYLEQGHELMRAYLYNFQFRLKTESAKKIYEEVQQTQSFDWLLPHEKKGYHQENKA